MVNRNYLSIIILLMISSFVSWELYFFTSTQKDTVNVNDFPQTIGPWTSQDMPIDKVDREILETKNVFMRHYSKSGDKDVYLYIAYSQSNPKATNPPEVFYKESGISIIDKGKESVIIDPFVLPIKVNWLLLENNQSKQIAYYWFKIGDIYTYSYWKQQALAAIDYLRGKKTGTALIRISADIKNGHENEANKLIEDFASRIGPQLSSFLP